METWHEQAPHRGGFGRDHYHLASPTYFCHAARCAATWPIAARSQQPTMPVIGFISSRSPGESEPDVAGFRQGLTQAGYVEHQNVTIEYRWAENRYEQLPALAADLVKRQVAVITAVGGPVTALAVKAATKTVPPDVLLSRCS